MNYTAIMVSAIVGYVLGMLWYSPALFGKQWMKLVGLTEKDMEKAKKKGMAKQMIIALVAVIVMSYVLSLFVQFSGAVSFAGGIITGFWIWLGFLATTMLNPQLWQGKPWALYVLNTGHYLVALALMGGILAAWN
jgi:accessory gene regulator protein AgrB